MKTMAPMIRVALLLSALLWPIGLRGADAGVNAWTTNGPEGGGITTLAIDPQTPTTVYAGTWGAGVFKSTNGGANWSPANTGLPSPAISALAVDPLTPATLYGGTSDAGVFKSTDGGGSWSPINTGLTNLRILALAIDPHSPTTLYAGTDGGVFKSSDGGSRWSAPTNHLYADTLAIDPQAPATLYAGSFKSTDGGSSWSATGLTSLDVSVYALAIEPQTPATLYAGTNGGVFKSTDGGANWRAANTGLTRPLGVSVWALAIDPQTPTTLYAGTTGAFAGAGGVFKSIDGGDSWSAVNTGLPGFPGFAGQLPGNATVLAIDPRTPATVYAGALGRYLSDSMVPGMGVFKSTDGGKNWNSVNAGLTAIPVRKLAIDPQARATLYAGALGAGVFKSTDGGTSWSSVNDLRLIRSTGIYDLAVDPQTPTNIYVSSTGNLMKSTDGGMSWAATGPSSIQALAIDPHAPATLYAGTEFRVLKSTDGGTTWRATGFRQNSVFALAIDPQAPATLYAGTRRFYLNGDRAGVVKSTDGGASWSAVNTGLPNAAVVALAIDPQTPTTLYAGTFFDRSAGVGGVFKSIDGGDTWSAVNTGLTNLDVRALAIDPQTPATLYAGTYGGGVFKSTDGGVSWSAFNPGLTNLFVESVVVDPRRPTTLYASTGVGVFVLFTPADASERLIEAVRRSLPSEEPTSLIGPLRHVARLLTDANQANDRAACGRLDAFIDQVNVKERSGELTAAQAGQLRLDAEDITAALGCP
jgi:photosystem II stability/assembly factor-like uncharacterized protein